MKRDADNIALIKQVVSLARALIELRDIGVQVGKSSPKDYPGFLYVGTYDRDAESCYYVNESTGQVLHNTWQISGHNGDSYGDEYVILDADSASEALKSMCSGFISRGIDRERQIKEEELRKEETQRLRDRFLSRVK